MVAKASTTQKTQKKSKKFDLDALKKKDSDAVQEAHEIFPNLSQSERDLIKHEAPEAYAAITALNNRFFAGVQQTTSATYSAHSASSTLAHDSLRETLNSDKSESEKRDTNEKIDRMDARAKNNEKDIHAKSMDTYLEGAKVVAAALVVVTGIVLLRPKD